MRHSDECIRPEDVADEVASGNEDIAVYERAIELGMRIVDEAKRERVQLAQVALDEANAKVLRLKKEEPAGTWQEGRSQWYKALNEAYVEAHKARGTLVDALNSE